jgi:hypothetical protein
MIVSWDGWAGKEANAGGGGPRLHYRKERITSSLLGKDDGEIRCPRIIRIGFDLKSGEDPLERLNRLLLEEGYDRPEDLLKDIWIPDRRYVCRPSTVPLCTLDAAPDEVFRHALMLGLCTAHLFDPARPVIWTRSSLSRVLDLFDPQGFYQ